MRIAVMSDTHDNIWKLERALSRIQEVDVVLHCGDLCAPFMIRHLGDGLEGVPVHVVWGNNDGDQHLLTEAAGGYENVHLHGLTARLNLDGWSVAVNHYPDLGRDLALSGQYDLVCYGHDHTAHQQQLEGCMLLNPGEIMGMNGTSSFVVVNTESAEARFVEV